MELYVGVALMAFGLMLFFIGRSKSKIVRVEAREGSVAVGGNNTGSITNIGAPPAPARGSHALTYWAIAVELAGIMVTLWHVWHTVAR